jgi:phosphoribosylformylglycinamidine cyclo-ligase
VRRIVEGTDAGWATPAPFAEAVTLGEALLVPTRIYVRPLLALHRAGLMKAAAHITGGGLPGNLPRVLPAGTRAVLDAGTWDLPPVFGWLARGGGVQPEEMLRVFNCGIGMAVVTAEPAAARAVLEAAGETVFAMGRIEAAAADAEPETRIDLPADWLA